MCHCRFKRSHGARAGDREMASSRSDWRDCQFTGSAHGGRLTFFAARQPQRQAGEDHHRERQRSPEGVLLGAAALGLAHRGAVRGARAEGAGLDCPCRCAEDGVAGARGRSEGRGAGVAEQQGVLARGAARRRSGTVKAARAGSESGASSPSSIISERALTRTGGTGIDACAASPTRRRMRPLAMVRSTPPSPGEVATRR